MFNSSLKESDCTQIALSQQCGIQWVTERTRNIGCIGLKDLII